MKIIVCDPMEAEAIQQMRAAGLEVDVRDKVTAEELIQVISGYDGMVVRSRTRVPAALIDAASRLKVIVRGGVGLDTIDVEHARAKGIKVMNTPAASSASVAELTLGYMFAMARHIYEATASMKAGKWEKNKFKGVELGGKTLGIAGIGNIGKEVAKRALALGMQVIAYDPYVQAPQGVEQIADMDEILRRSDYLTFHLPLTEETRNMIGPAEFARMKTGVRIVNCARGGIVDEDALYDALVSGKVAGAALDVYAVEPSQGHKLFTLDQVIGSPHIGAATEEAQGRVGAEVAQILIEFARQNQ
jgi:D-3-phosphoglycerate dehydrogenase